MTSLKFTIFGEPHGKGRPRMTRKGHPYTPENTALYENLIKIEYRNQCGAVMFPQGVPLSLDIKAYYSIPQSKSKKQQTLMREEKVLPTKKPDWDNIGKVVADSLNKVAYYDDAQIVNASICKLYSDTPRVEITIEEVTL